VIETRRPLARTIVKVCGITRIEDARVARDAGADWIGFIVHGESPRRITPEQAAEIGAAVPELTRVAVMVGVTPEEALAIATRAGVQRVQIHRPPITWPAEFPLPAAIVVPVGSDRGIPSPLPDPRHLLMLDSAHPHRAGGTGETFPWDAAIAVAGARAVLLAGGLGPDNVAEAIERVNPYGVDASSRLESQPGIKDAGRVRRFVSAVRDVEIRVRGRRP
jgi:phosphoribosylanthranilate isomerase